MINIPNLITIFRIVLIPVFLIFLIEHAFTTALLVCAVAGMSDAVDGFVARTYNRKTLVGAYLDPIADKLLLSTAFITLAIMKFIPAWLAVLVISRDVLIILGHAVFFICQLRFEPRPTLISKITTHFQFYTILLALSVKYVSEIGTFLVYLFYLTAMVTISSGLHYMYMGYKIAFRGNR
jgi:cardiolipin synthase